MDFLNAFVLFANFVLVPAIAYGAQLALGALGVTLIYAVLRFSNFAHGDMMAFGTMLVILVTWGLQALGVGLGAAADRAPRAALRHPRRRGARAPDRPLGLSLLPPRRSAPVIFVIASVGVMFIYNALTRFVIGTDEQRFEDGARFVIRVDDFKEMTGLEEGLALRASQLLTVVVMLVTVAVVFWFLQKTRTGKAMRAYSDNEDLALLSGISPDRVVMITWIVAAALATIAGTLYGLDKSFRPFTYFQLLLPIFAAAIVGGIGQPFGAIAGGFIIAFSEVMLTYAYKGVLAYSSASAARGPRADARHRLQVRRLLHHPGRRAADPADRHLPGAGDMTDTARVVLLYAVMAAADRRRRPRPELGGRRSTILNLCLISAVMSLGVNIQWGYAGLFNTGIMGFAALGGVAAVLVSMRPVPGALAAGGWNLGLDRARRSSAPSAPRSSSATASPATCARPPAC